MARGEPGTYAIDNAVGIDVVRAGCFFALAVARLKKCYHATACWETDVSLCERYALILDTIRSADDNQKSEKRWTFPTKIMRDRDEVQGRDPGARNRISSACASTLRAGDLRGVNTLRRQEVPDATGAKVD